ncbi:MAG: Factor arrest protein 11 [Chaenotheca gracillima]|nr:MAG: Factor arrest protein 11 [Chaenotheca gracillima]
MAASHVDITQEPLVIKADEVDSAEVGLAASSSMDITDTGVESSESSAPSNQNVDGITRREVPSPNILLPTRPAMKRNQSQPPPPQQPPPPPAPQGQQQLNNQNDSLSLSQLKQIVTQLPRFERTAYAFEYKDTTSFMEELDEWFSYNNEEYTQLSHARASFEDRWLHFNSKDTSHDHSESKWTSTSTSDSSRSRFLRNELACIENPHVKARSPHLESILYVLLGVWGETADQTASDRSGADTSTSSPVNSGGVGSKNSSVQSEWMTKGAELIYESLGVQTVFDVLRSACLREWDEKFEPAESTPDHLELASLESQELTNSLTAMYLLVEAGRHQVQSAESPKLREEIASLDPDYLFFLVKILTKLRWDDTTDLPLTKMLLLFWKSLLLLFGGIEELQATKSATQEQPSSAQNQNSETLITASPLDYHVFRQEITSKYPAYKPPPLLIPLEVENNSILPPLLTSPGRNESNGLSAGLGPATANVAGGSILHQPVHIATPAPSPPPSPVGPGGKGGKKQNFQTNQNFPFLYPPLDGSSNSAGGKGTAGLQEFLVGRKWEGSDIPASILEAGELFAGRTRMTRSIKQLWNERENYMKFERGWGTLNKDAGKSKPDSPGHDEDAKRAKLKNTVPDKVLDADVKRRLDAVEEFYRNSLPHLQSLVIVLLKVVLQNVTALITQINNGTGQNGFVPGFQPQDQNGVLRGKSKDSGEQNGEGPNSVNGSLEEIDDVRSREIVAKAVSGLLIMMLKWFKVSHILKFEYLTQLLLDSNYLPLILKLFAHQDLDRVVDSKPDVTDFNFSTFCQKQARKGPLKADDKESSDDEACPPPVVRMRRTGSPSVAEDRASSLSSSAGRDRPPEVDELGYPTSEQPSEPITSFSWRNFFSSINFLRIMQKICKHKAHRNLLLVQYKSSTILKKSLKVPQPDLRLYTLKLFKNQVPYCGRKWRQSNMRVITAVYLHCRPELRDDWLAGSDVDAEVEEALPLEQALRALTHWHNMKRYPEQMGADVGVLEEEQDFFLRELERMDFSEVASAVEEGNDGAWEGSLHMEGW